MSTTSQRKHLPATAFGKTLSDGRWGPLDSAEIIDNINNAPKVPEDGANTSQVWSAGTLTGSITSGRGADKAFDGDLTTNFLAAELTTATFTLGTPLTGISNLEVYARISKVGETTDLLKINGNDYTANWSDDGTNFTWQTVSENNLTSFTASNAGPYVNIAAFRVDGRLLVDTGVWNASQNWSDYLVASNGSFGTSAPATNGFNGAVGNDDIAQAVSGTNPNNITFTPVGGIPYTSSVKVYITNAENQVSINGGALQTIAANSYVQIASGSGTINNIVFQRASPSGAIIRRD